MYCSKCGRATTDTQALCPACGHPVEGSQQVKQLQTYEQQRFDHSMLRLSRFWYLFAALNIALGVVGWVLFDQHLTHLVGPWEPWPHPPGWSWTLASDVVWTLFVSRVMVALLAGWGLKEHTEWGRPVALLAAAVALFQFPIGVVLGIYTLAALFGRHHAVLYEHWADAK